MKEKFEPQTCVKDGERYYLCYIDPDDVTSSLQREYSPAQMLQTSKDVSHPIYLIVHFHYSTIRHCFTVAN